MPGWGVKFTHGCFLAKKKAPAILSQGGWLINLNPIDIILQRSTKFVDKQIVHRMEARGNIS
ncbi:hypothetical protein M493_16375 [Geobacillus genomosp. 3]|uniref:Uncharacterized protein n=1 Tax=Geobacillus genomosp. 3 TaxID=1921421 RepID=S5Z355_GEOG3|nr:hypothetical protein M493_16375 [Geobacillus genomosp. 3]